MASSTIDLRERVTATVSRAVRGRPRNDARSGASRAWAWAARAWAANERTRARYQVFLLLALVSLPGCAHMQKERGHDTVDALVRARTGQHTGWQSGSPEARQIDERVKALLASGLTRERAVQIALLNNPELQETYDELDVSQADLLQAGLLSNPTLAGSIGFELNGSAGPEYEASIVQSFLDLFLLPLRKRVARAEFDAQTLRVAHATLEVASEVNKEFVSFQAAEQTLSLMRGIAEGVDAAATFADRQFEAGNISERARATERASSVAGQMDVRRDELELMMHRERLNRLLGLGGANLDWKLAQKLPAVPPGPPLLAHLEQAALRQRLDVQAARKQVELMDLALGVTRGSRFTGLVNVGLHVHRDVTGPQLFGPTVALELPIFDQRQALIGRLEAQRRQAQRRLDGIGLNVRSEVRQAVARLELNRRAAEQYLSALLPLRRVVLQQSELEYNAMQMGLYELLAMKKSEVETMRGYLETVRDYWVARAELERALGGRISQPKTAFAERAVDSNENRRTRQ